MTFADYIMDKLQAYSPPGIDLAVQERKRIMTGIGSQVQPYFQQAVEQRVLSAEEAQRQFQDTIRQQIEQADISLFADAIARGDLRADSLAHLWDGVEVTITGLQINASGVWAQSQVSHGTPVRK